MRIPSRTPTKVVGPASNARAGGFTLVELMVSMAIFVIMALLLVALADITMRVTGQSHRRIDGDAAARQVLDRISADLARAILRDDLPIRVDKPTGNDGISFVANVDGYVPGRGMSVISIKSLNGMLQRGVDATSWSSGSDAMGFTSVADAAAMADYLESSGSGYDDEVIAKDVFRFEIAFLMSDGTVKADVGSAAANGTSRVTSLAASSGTPPSDTIKAIIVGLAAIDERAREAIGPSGLAELQSAFPDAVDGHEDLLELWEDYPSAPIVADTPVVRESIRVHQRHIPINN